MLDESILEAIAQLTSERSGAATSSLPDTPPPTHRYPVRGFSNTGNSCYQNAVMQALLGCNSFCWALRLIGKCFPALSVTATGYPVILAFAKFHRALLSGAGGDTERSPSSSTSLRDQTRPIATATTATTATTGTSFSRPSFECLAAVEEDYMAAVVQEELTVTPKLNLNTGSNFSSARTSQRGPHTTTTTTTTATNNNSSDSNNKSSSSSGGGGGGGGGPISCQMFDVVVDRFNPRATSTAQLARVTSPTRVTVPGSGSRSTDDGGNNGNNHNTAGPSWAGRVASGKGHHGSSAGTRLAGEREQEDAQEFLTHALDYAHEELLALAHQVSSASKGADHHHRHHHHHHHHLLHAVSSSEGCQVAQRHLRVEQEQATGGGSRDDGGDVVGWEVAGKNNRGTFAHQVGSLGLQGHQKTAFSVVFGGALTSTVRAEGAKPSVTVQPFNVLQLEIFNPWLPPHMNNVRSLEDALNVYTMTEQLQYYKVETTGREVAATKSLRLHLLPDTLILHLKRFTYAEEGQIKVTKHIVFEDTLRIKPSMLSDSSPHRVTGGVQYELRATVSHHGTTPMGGHYTADVKQEDGSWLRFDDASVVQLSRRQVLDQRVYLVMYQRV